MIVEIGEWVLRKACESLEEIAKKCCGIEKIAIVIFKQSFVAEGVETVEQLKFLMHRACDYAQGHLFGEPVSIEALHERVIRIDSQLRLDRNVTVLKS